MNYNLILLLAAVEKLDIIDYDKLRTDISDIIRYGKLRENSYIAKIIEPVKLPPQFTP